MGRVIVLGSLMTDLVARAARLPLPGESLLGEEFGIFVGGKGCNQAVAAARLGARASLIGRVGTDSFGDTFLEALDVEGVEHRYATRDPEMGTGASVIVLGANGQNAIVATPRANFALTPGDVEAALSALVAEIPAEERARTIFLTQCETPLATVETGLRLARAAGCRTILNAAPIPREPLEDALLALAEILIVNETEAAALAKMPIESPEAAREAGALLLARGPRQVVLTLGEWGCTWCGGADGGNVSTCVELFAYVVHAVDATAAGDAFCGALAASLADGLPLAEALRWANAAGALAVTRLGALPSLPRRAEVEQLLARA